ncbi:MAG: hypothetical protein UY97_C0004G0012 [Parcubacteria group bacterium GW2011_GWB1_57_6]|nr:MAG: hypothetical protein UY93_C0002G0447 [Parcubacteria group bacterium GW2011_GWA1_56_13]KKW46623.1 MAG: hypothetical protein UY97_C0004G0012 [Parcubacteria group bacterium GW2011_GWB1_57_6]
MNATPSSVTVPKKKAPAEQKPATRVLKPGKRRIIGTTKFGKDGCGY